MSFSVTSNTGGSSSANKPAAPTTKKPETQPSSASYNNPPAKGISTSIYKDIHKKADSDSNGSLTRQEFDSFYEKNPIGADDIPDDQLATYNIDRYFDSIAYRALKKDEVTTYDARETDATIELADLEKLAGFDGNNNDISDDDLGLLQKQPDDSLPVEPDNGNGENPFIGGCIPPQQQETRQSVYNELVSYLGNFFAQSPLGFLFQGLGLGGGLGGGIGGGNMPYDYNAGGIGPGAFGIGGGWGMENGIGPRPMANSDPYFNQIPQDFGYDFNSGYPAMNYMMPAPAYSYAQ